jgi:hypothetical protein
MKQDDENGYDMENSYNTKIVPSIPTYSYFM